MTHLIRLTQNGCTLASCGPGCFNAAPGECNCCCDGLNHAVGHAQAIANTQRDGLERARIFIAKHPWAERCLIYTLQKAPPNLTRMLF